MSTEEIAETPEPVVVTPLPFVEDMPVVISSQAYTAMTLQHEGRDGFRVPTPVKNNIAVLLDEIDIASSIPEASQQIRVITAKIRKLL